MHRFEENSHSRSTCVVACDPFCPIEFKLSRRQTCISKYIFFCIWSRHLKVYQRKYFKTHFSPNNLLFSRSEAYSRSCNTGVAACGLFCSLNVKLLTNQSWENLCFQTRSLTRFSIKSSRFSITGSQFSIVDTLFSQESRIELRIETRNRLSTYF